MSVRQSENFVKIFKKNNKTISFKKDPNINSLEDSLRDKIGLSVKIKNNKNNKGTITFSYHGTDQLNKLIEIIKANY